jgi:hypothetical protein
VRSSAGPAPSSRAGALARGPRCGPHAPTKPSGDNSTPSAAGRRVWEFSGGILRCGECHTNMMSHSVAGARVKGRLFYYYCCRKRHRDGAEGCPHRRNRRGSGRAWRG